jgi:hypothetical protein
VRGPAGRDDFPCRRLNSASKVLQEKRWGVYGRRYARRLGTRAHDFGSPWLPAVNGAHRIERRAWRDSRTPSADPEQLHLEHQRRAGRNDAARAARAIAERGWDGEFVVPPTSIPCTPSSQPLITRPPPSGKRKFKRIVAVLARVELCAVGEPACVMNGDLLKEFS